MFTSGYEEYELRIAVHNTAVAVNNYSGDVIFFPVAGCVL